MIRPGRNDPCPCGSGRKYKRCCRTRDLAAEEGASRTALRRSAATGAEGWEVEAVPLLTTIEEKGSERPVMILVMAGEVIVHQELLGRLPGDVTAVAEALADGVTEAARDVGVWPARVTVRQREVQQALAPLLAPRDLTVELRPELPGLEACARSLMEVLGGYPHWPPISRTESWLGWDLPRPVVADLFEAAAEFWRAEPWRTMENMQAPRCVLPSGRAWTAMVLGNGGEEFGLVLHSEAVDAFERPGLEDPEIGFGGITGRIVSLLFEPLSDMPKRARKEIATMR